MILSSEKLVTWEACNRRTVWTDKYAALRVSPIGTLYRALDAGLRAEGNPEAAAMDEVMALATSPGLDITGKDIYGIAMHIAKLAGIIAVALRSASAAPWGVWPDVEIGNDTNGRHTWRSACYDAGDGMPRRIVLVDRWGDERRGIETRGWRTLGELAAIRKPIMLTAVVIGSTHDGKRISPWTRVYSHPRNRMYRFKRKTAAEDFGANWEPIWRENSDIPTAEWLTLMAKDGCITDGVHTMKIPVPERWTAYMRQMQKLAKEMEEWKPLGNQQAPAMRLAGCDGFSPCPFRQVCHGSLPPVPESYKFQLRKSAATPSEIPCHPSVF